MNDEPLILTVNAGSSSIKFAMFTSAVKPERLLSGQIVRIGGQGTELIARNETTGAEDARKIDGLDYRGAAKELIEYLRQQMEGCTPAGIGHRVVHGGAKLIENQLITPAVLAELRAIQPLDLSHLPSEIALIEIFGKAFPGVPQVACFDTEFFRDLPTVAAMLPIPRHYYDQGIRRFGFHGLSYTYLMQKLAADAGAEAAQGRIILAHLGSGASMAAVRNGKPIDTTMGFTPMAGLVMGTRPGDLDPGLLVYLMRSEKMSADKMDEFISSRCGLLGVSETVSDMQDLLKRRASDPRAAEAVALFCYQAKKFMGALAAAMGGLDALVFSGGIGEHAAEARAEICDGLTHLNITIDPQRNASNEAIISRADSHVAVRVIATDEELIIAQAVRALANVQQ